MVYENRGGIESEQRIYVGKPKKVSIVEGITKLLNMGYKAFRLDGNGNYVAEGKRTKLKGRGWSKTGNQHPTRESEGTEDTTLCSKELIIKGASFEKLKNQYTKIMDGIRMISKLQHARSEVFQETFKEITIFKNMINENSEQLHADEQLTQAHSLLESVEKAEEIVQRYYLNGLGDYGCETERRAIAAEENRRNVEEFRNRQQEYSINNTGSSSHSTITANSNGNQDHADVSENR